MIKYNDEYEAEIKEIVKANPKNYARVLKSRGFKGRYPDRKYLVDYIYQCTPMLDDSIHEFKTRVYWTINRLSDFPECGNTVHGAHKMTSMNVLSMEEGYPKFCCAKCRYEAPAYYDAVKAGIRRKYGVDNAFQIQEVKDDLRERRAEIQSKRDATRTSHFGDSPGWNLEKSLETRRRLYGSAWNVKAIAKTKAERYGDSGWNNSSKAYATKKKNGTLNTSRQENVIFEAVRTVCPEMVSQYKSAEYPFSCDMYDPATRTYFEYNGSWTHGGHPYDPGSPEDEDTLRRWKGKGTKYYDNAVETWTVRDPRKRATAKASGLNLVEFWNYSDVEKYFKFDFGLDDWLYFDCPPKTLDAEYRRFRKECFSGNWRGFLHSRNSSNAIVKFFQQDVFYAREKRAWLDPEIRGRLVENRKKYLGKPEKELTDLDMLDGFKRSGMIYGYSHFNPRWFMWFINEYGVRSCYDPFGGWGHRLLGSARLERYIYNDFSRGTKRNVDRIISAFKIGNAETHCEDARTFMPKSSFDAMFTCPPYYNVEEYECGGFSDFGEYKALMDGVFEVFESKPECRVFGIVTREDMLCGHDGYDLVFDVNVGRSYHINKADGKKREKLYVFKKTAR